MNPSTTAQALQRHYASGGHPAGWQQQYVSAYATSHPWEDWAETWAHYLHMVDLLETAASYNTRVEVPGAGTDEVEDPIDGGAPDFDQLVEQWVPVTLLVNSLNRSLGQGDAYPFALSQTAIDKLRFVARVIRSTGTRPARCGAARACGSCADRRRVGDGRPGTGAARQLSRAQPVVSVSWLLTDFTSLTFWAISLARAFAAALGTDPLSVTTPSRVSTSMRSGLSSLSAFSPVRTIAVSLVSSTFGSPGAGL